MRVSLPAFADLVVVFGLMAIIVLTGCKNHSDAGSGSSASGKPQDSSGSGSIEFTVDELNKEFGTSGDELLAAAKKYAGKTIRVTGKVSGDDKFADKDSLVLEDSKGKPWKFFLQTTPASKPKKGETVTLHGKCDDTVGVLKWEIAK
jgi:hypothetical protein